VEAWLEAEDNRAISAKVGKAKGGLKSGEPPAKRMSPGTGADHNTQYKVQGRIFQGVFNDSKELGRSERDSRSVYDSKENYFNEEPYARGKRHSICSNYEDDFEDEDLDDSRGDQGARSKNRFK
jgi:hypothetical protein